MKKTLLCLALALCLLLSCLALADGEKVTVEVRDSDGVTVLNELEVAKGAKITADDLGVSKDGCTLEGVYVTPALLRPYNFDTELQENTVLFVAWKSARADERPWMLAGGLTDYPDNAWGKVWPQDGYRLQPVEGEFNTFDIKLNLHAGDEFKIAVIGEGYAWSDTDSLDSRNVIKSEYVTGGEDAFDTGANIKVLQDGYYRVVLTTDAETISVCKIALERLSDLIEIEVAYTFDLQVHASFLGWDVARNVVLTRNGSDYIWYGEFDCEDDEGEFGIKNYGSEAWFAGEDGNIKVTRGHYMVFIKLTEDNKLAEPIVVETPAYYVVGTCGSGGWAADAKAGNETYKLAAQDDGTYALNVVFTEADTADWAGNKVAFKVVYGCGGNVANEFWYGDSGENITVDPGQYTIVFDPAAKIVTVR